MRVLLLTTHLDIGGISNYTVWLAEGLTSRGHEVKVASSGGELVSELQAKGIPHLKVNIRTKNEISPRVYLAAIRLNKVIKKSRIDLIHAQTRVTQVVAHCLSKLSDIPYLTTCHGFFKVRWGRRVFPCWGQRVIAISEPVMEHLLSDFKVPRKRVSLIPNGVDIDRYSKRLSEEEKIRIKREYGLRADGPVIGSIGRLSPVKGHRYLLEAFADILKVQPKVSLLIVGNGRAKANLIKLANKLDIANHVSFVEARRTTEVPLSIMDVFVHPSLQEGLGLAILEAMAAGLPVVASDVGGIYTLVKEGRNGLLVPPADSLALVEAIVKLLDKKELAERMGQEGRRLVSQRFSLDVMVQQIEREYKDIVTRRPEDILRSLL